MFYSGVDTKNITLMDMQAEADMDPQMMDGIASQLTAGDGEWDMVTEIEHLVTDI